MRQTALNEIINRSRLLCCGVLLAATAVNANAELQPGDRYVHMGSSFAAGPGIQNNLDENCGRSDQNYAHLVARELQLDLVDVSCNGATIDNIVYLPHTSPFGGETLPPQMEALTEDTRLVTITVGGNDFNYAGNLLRDSCQADPTPVADLPEYIADLICGPASPETNRLASDYALALVKAELSEMLRQIRERAPEATVVLVDYVSMLPPHGGSCGSVMPLSTEDARHFRRQANRFRVASKRAARQRGALIVQWSRASEEHHVCSDDPWANGWVFDLGTGVIGYHPNAEGMRQATRLVLEALSATE